MFPLKKEVWIEDQNMILDGIYTIRNSQIWLPIHNYSGQPQPIPIPNFDEAKEIKLKSVKKN